MFGSAGVFEAERQPEPEAHPRDICMRVTLILFLEDQ